MSAITLKSMTGYLSIINAAVSMDEFKNENSEFSNEFKVLLESCASENFQCEGFSFRVSVLMKLLVGNPSKKKLYNKTEQRFIEKKLFQLEQEYPDTYSEFRELLLFFSWDKQCPIGYCRLARLFLGESTDSVYNS